MDGNSFVFHVRTHCFPKVGQRNSWLTEKKAKKFDVEKKWINVLLTVRICRQVCFHFKSTYGNYTAAVKLDTVYHDNLAV